MAKPPTASSTSSPSSEARPDVTKMDPRQIETLICLMQALRTPGSGCPWDLEQDFASIAPYTIEEAYEVADAINRDNLTDLCEELGDLLLQVVYHAQMAAEAGAFSFADVVAGINRKMIRRHPHVFGDEAAKSANLAKDFWEQSKAKEKLDAPLKHGVLDNVPMNLPALTRALKLQAKAARVGFDWPSVNEVYCKIAEEIEEFRTASPPEKSGEYGDLLFALVNVARHMEINPEEALSQTNAKFTRRFKFIEQELEKIGKKPQTSDLAEMDALWNQAKSFEADVKQ